MLVGVLREIKTLLEQYAAKNGKYEDFVVQDAVDWDDREEPGSDLLDLLCLSATKNALQAREKASGSKRVGSVKHIRSFGKSIVQTGRTLRTIVTEPKRLVWAAVDKDSFEHLISKLEHLNSFLVALLDSSQIRKLQDAMNTAHLEILQLRNDVASLTTLVEALAPGVDNRQNSLLEDNPSASDPFSQAVEEGKAAQAERMTYLKELAEIKIQFTMLNEPDLRLLVPTETGNPGPLLPLDKFAFAEGGLEHDAPRLRMSTTYEKSNVWVEWKDVSAEVVSAPYIELVETRIILLTKLLCHVKPEGFRAPVCLGYTKILDDYGEATRFGIVFRNPSVNSMNSELTTLRELLGRMAKPSLSTRMSLCAVLARCVHSLHAVNWLHKALHPHNVIYYSDQPDLSAPFVSGFELSRPSIMDEMTEKPRFDPSKDIYRHPNAQSCRTDGNFRKSYDIYSLGIILIEVALWTSIEDIVGLENLSKTKPSVIQGMRSYLLGEPGQSTYAKLGAQCLPHVACACGDEVRNVVDRCLRADEIEYPNYRGEPKTSIALRLQRAVEQDVVKRLEHIARAL
jgi:hypothetical protein